MQKACLRRVGEYIIRRCAVEDLPHIFTINWASLPEHYSNTFFEQLLRDLPEAFLVAESDEKVVGYIMCRAEYGFSVMKRFSLAKKGHIISLAVLQEHRGRGLGHALVEVVLGALMDKGYSEVYLEVRVSNSSAVGLYESLGFDIVSRLSSYYKDGEDAYMMGKALSEAKF